MSLDSSKLASSETFTDGELFINFLKESWILYALEHKAQFLQPVQFQFEALILTSFTKQETEQQQPAQQPAQQPLISPLISQTRVKRILLPRTSNACWYHKKNHSRCSVSCKYHDDDKHKQNKRKYCKTNEYIVEKILNHRKDTLQKMEFLVKWKDYEESYNTWEPLKNFKRSNGKYTDALMKYIRKNSLYEIF